MSVRQQDGAGDVRPHDPRFDAAADLLRRAREGSRSRRSALRGLPRPVHALRAAVIVRALPTVTVPSTASPQGRALRAELCLPRTLGHRRFAVGYLAVPADGYDRGRDRQALRTNAHHAIAGGTSVHELTSVEERRSRFDDILAPTHDPRERDRWLGWVCSQSNPRCFAAVSADGVTLAVAAVTVDGQWARLTLVLTNRERPDSSDARYLLHKALIDELAAAGVRHLLSESLFAVPGGVRYFWHLLGFRAVNVRVTVARSELAVS